MKNTLRNTLSLYCALIFTFLLNFVQLKILTLYLSKKDVGLYFAASGVSLILGSIYLMGFPMIFPRYIPKYEVEKRLDDASKLYWLSVMIFLLASLITFTVFITLSKYRPSPFLNVLPIAFLSHIFFFLLSLSSSYYTGLRKMHISSMFNVSPFLIYNLLLYIFRNNLTILLTFYLLLISSVPVFIVSLFLLKPTFSLNRRIVREVKNYWLFSILTSLLSPFFLYMDRIFIASFLPLESLAIYMIARRIDQGIRKFLTIPVNVMAPEFSFYWEKSGGKRDFIEAVSLFSKIYIFLGLFFFLLLAYFGKWFILLISREAYLEAYPYLLILLAGLILTSLYIPYTLVARSLGKMNLYFFSDLVWVISYFILFPFLVKLWGLFGASLTVLFSTFITLVFVFYLVRPRIISFPYSPFYIFSNLIITLLGFLLSFSSFPQVGVLSIPLLLIFGIGGIKKEEWKVILKGIEKV